MFLRICLYSTARLMCPIRVPTRTLGPLFNSERLPWAGTVLPSS